jgi:hypothetical protein
MSRRGGHDPVQVRERGDVRRLVENHQQWWIERPA